MVAPRPRPISLRLGGFQLTLKSTVSEDHNPVKEVRWKDMEPCSSLSLISSLHRLLLLLAAALTRVEERAHVASSLAARPPFRAFALTSVTIS
jgi:hypothetical protein